MLEEGPIAKFKVGDVLKLHCEGEIENTDLQSREVNVLYFFILENLIPVQILVLTSNEKNKLECVDLF